ncbi:MAG: IS66 family transposase [Pseudomonadota bacterium]
MHTTTINDSPKTLEEAHQIIRHLRITLDSTKIELDSTQAKYDYLIEQLRLAKQHRFGKSSEKNILQGDLFDEAGIELPEEATEEFEVKTHARKKHPVRKPIPADLPREVIIHDVSESEKICDCGSALVKIGEQISEQIKYIPAQLSVIQHVRPKYACKPCQEHVKIAKMPTLLLPKSIATPELVAHIIISKYMDHLPLYRQEAIWQRIGIDMPRSSLCGWILKVAELCDPLIQLLQKEIITHDYIQADETTLQVLNEAGRANTAKSYMWIYQGGDIKHPAVVFDYQETRGGYHAQAFLKGFKGYLQTDAYSGYNFTDQYDEIIALGCMAHARRPFSDLVKISKKTGLATEGIHYFQRLYAIEKYARENKLSHDERYELRKLKAPPILDTFKKWLETHLTKVPKQHRLGQGIQYVLKHWNELTAYLKDGRLEIDNNFVENLIRPLALGRKNWLFAGSPSGAKAAAVFYSLIATCQLNNVEPYQYLCKMLHQIHFCETGFDFEKLLPQKIVMD